LENGNLERKELLDFLTDGNIGFTLKDFYHPIHFKNEGSALMYSILFGGLAKVSHNLIDYDAMVSQLLRERTMLCLKYVSEDMRPAIRLLKEDVSEQKKEGKPIPRILKGYLRGKKSFTNHELDLRVSLQDVKELLDFIQST